MAAKDGAVISDKEYLEWLTSTSKGCISTEAIELLVEATTSGCNGEIKVDLGDTLFAIPCSQLPEAWANLIHVHCIDDYQLDSIVKLKPGDIVVDGGAYIGFFAVKVAHAMKRDGLIIAVEPNPAARSILYKNFELNSLERIARIDPRSLGGCEYCLREIHVTEPWVNTSMYKSYIAEMQVEVFKTFRVASISLKKLMKDHGLDAISLLKLDVEGAEQEILERASSDGILLPSTISQVIVEVHPPLIRVEDIEALLRDNGYKTIVKSFGGGWKQAVVIGIS